MREGLYPQRFSLLEGGGSPEVQPKSERDEVLSQHGGGAMPRIAAEELRSLGARIFERLQVPHEEAVWVTELLVRANLVGHDSHGAIRIPQYAQAIRSGLVKPGVP